MVRANSIRDYADVTPADQSMERFLKVTINIDGAIAFALKDGHTASRIGEAIASMVANRTLLGPLESQG